MTHLETHSPIKRKKNSGLVLQRSLRVLNLVLVRYMLVTLELIQVRLPL
jgi:hypothetical protein